MKILHKPFNRLVNFYILVTHQRAGYIQTTISKFRFKQFANTITLQEFEEETTFLYFTLLFTVERARCNKRYHR